MTSREAPDRGYKCNKTITKFVTLIQEILYEQVILLSEPTFLTQGLVPQMVFAPFGD